MSIQYRMAPAIGELVAAAFYPGVLRTGRGDPPAWYAELPPPLDCQVVWVDTAPLGNAGFERRGQQTRTSFANDSEVDVILALLQQIADSESVTERLRHDLRDGERGIGVICTYKEQKRFFLERLNARPWATKITDLVKVDTVDSYQGKENAIVLVSLVRNNASSHVGFAKSVNRINVALSRAKERLVIVGSTAVWGGNWAGNPLASVVRHIRERSAAKRAALVDATVMLRSPQ